MNCRFFLGISAVLLLLVGCSGGGQPAPPAPQPNPVPSITAITPDNVTAGSQAATVTVTGTGFLSTSVCQWGGYARPTTYVSGTQLQVTLPASDFAAAGTWQMAIVNPTPGGGTSNKVVFSVNNPVPAISTISPNTATAGGAAISLTISGTGFVASSAAQWSGSNRTTTFVSVTQLLVALPASDFTAAGTFQITVVNGAPGGGTSNAVTFTVTNPTPNPVPALTSISPSNTLVGSGAFTLTINGSNFVAASVLKWGGSNRVTTFVSATQLTAAITANDVATAGTVQVQVVNPAPGGGTSNSLTFTVNNPVPKLTSLTPTSATAGGVAFSLTANGSLFAVGAVLRWNAANRATTPVSATQLQAAITAADIGTAGTASVTVFNPGPGGGTSNALTFTINPAAIVGFAYINGGYLTPDRVFTFGVGPNGHLRNTGYEFTAGQTWGLIASPNYKNLYAAGGNGNYPYVGSVQVFSIDQTTGKATPSTISSSELNRDYRYPAIDPAGKFLYVPANYGGSTAVFAIDPNDGSLAEVSGSPFPAGGGPHQAIVTPSGKFLYVTNDATNNITAYSIDSSTGALTTVAGSPFPADDSPWKGVVDPSGKFLYVVNHFSSKLSAYSINSTTGSLTPLAGSPFATGWYPDDVTVHPNGKFLFVGDMGYNNATGGDIVTYAINPSTGVPTPLGSPVPADSATWSIQLDASGTRLYATGLFGMINAYQVNPTTGAVAFLEATFQSGPGVSIALIPALKPVAYTPKFAYTANALTNNISGFAIDAGSGTLTGIAASPFALGASPAVLAGNPAGKFLYASNPAANQVFGFSLNGTSGAPSAVPGSPFAAGAYPRAVAIEPSGYLAYTANKNDDSLSGFTVDPATGTWTRNAQTWFIGLGQGPNSVAMHPSGQLLYVVNSTSNSISGFSIDKSSNGYLAFLDQSPYATSVGPGEALVEPTGRFLYLLNPGLNTISIFSIALGSGALTAINQTYATSSQPVALAVDPFAKYLYVAHGQSGDIRGYSINSVTGALTPLSGSPFASSAIANAALAVDYSGKFLYVQGNASNQDAFLTIYTINPSTGNLTAVSGTPPVTGRGASSVLTTGKIQ